MGNGKTSMPQNGSKAMTEEQELRLFLYIFCNRNIQEAQMAYNFIVGNFDIDKNPLMWRSRFSLTAFEGSENFPHLLYAPLAQLYRAMVS